MTLHQGVIFTAQICSLWEGNDFSCVCLPVCSQESLLAPTPPSPATWDPLAPFLPHGYPPYLFKLVHLGTPSRPVGK